MLHLKPYNAYRQSLRLQCPRLIFISLICSALNLHCLWLLKYREREINIIGLALGQNHPWQCARQAFEIIGAYPCVWGIKIIPRLFAREREAQCPGLKGRVPHGSANWLRRSDTGISFCRREEEDGGEMKIGGVCLVVLLLGVRGGCAGGKQFQWFPQPGTVQDVDGCTAEELLRVYLAFLFVSLLGGGRRRDERERSGFLVSCRS